jgi:hypothetical protein
MAGVVRNRVTSPHSAPRVTADTCAIPRVVGTASITIHLRRHGFHRFFDRTIPSRNSRRQALQLVQVIRVP